MMNFVILSTMFFITLGLGAVGLELFKKLLPASIRNWIETMDER